MFATRLQRKGTYRLFSSACLLRAELNFSQLLGDRVIVDVHAAVNALWTWHFLRAILWAIVRVFLEFGFNLMAVWRFKGTHFPGDLILSFNLWNRMGNITTLNFFQVYLLNFLWLDQSLLALGIFYYWWSLPRNLCYAKILHVSHVLYLVPTPSTGSAAITEDTSALLRLGT